MTSDWVVRMALWVVMQLPVWAVFTAGVVAAVLTRRRGWPGGLLAVACAFGLFSTVAFALCTAAIGLGLHQLSTSGMPFPAWIDGFFAATSVSSGLVDGFVLVLLAIALLGAAWRHG